MRDWETAGSNNNVPLDSRAQTTVVQYARADRKECQLIIRMGGLSFLDRADCNKKPFGSKSVHQAASSACAR